MGDGTSGLRGGQRRGRPAGWRARRPVRVAGNGADTNDNASLVVLGSRFAAARSARPGPNAASPDTNTHTDTDADTDAHADAHADTHTNADTDTDAHADAHADTDADAHADRDTDAHPDAHRGDAATPTPTATRASADPDVHPGAGPTPTPTPTPEPLLSIGAARRPPTATPSSWRAFSRRRSAGQRAGAVQDATGGIALLLPADPAEPIVAGALVRASGTVGDRYAQRTNPARRASRDRRVGRPAPRPWRRHRSCERGARRPAAVTVEGAVVETPTSLVLGADRRRIRPNARDPRVSRGVLPGSRRHDQGDGAPRPARTRRALGPAATGSS